MARFKVTETERLVVNMAQSVVSVAAQRYPGYLSRVMEVLSAMSEGRIDYAIEVLESLQKGGV